MAIQDTQILSDVFKGFVTGIILSQINRPPAFAGFTERVSSILFEASIARDCAYVRFCCCAPNLHIDGW